MSKLVRITIVILVLAGLTFVVQKGMKKSGDGSVNDSGDTAGTQKVDEHGNPIAADGSSNGSSTDTAQGSGSGSGAAGTQGMSDQDSIRGAAIQPKSDSSDVKHEPFKPESNCFAFEYKHRKEMMNKDIEDFLDYSNAFPIFHEKVASKSICVKVNGKPTAFKVQKTKGKEEIVIGSVVGPESAIKVSYCVATTACKESCAIKSNRLMDDLMSDAGEEDEFRESWGDAKEQKKELQGKVKEFRSVASENRDLQKQSTVRDWDTVSQNEWFCKGDK